MTAATSLSLPSTQTFAVARSATYEEGKTALAKEAPRGRLTTWDAVCAYVFAGRAVFTLRSTKTGARLTYKVTAKKEDLERRAVALAKGGPFDEGDVAYFVNLLRGPDNTKDFAYMGVLRKPGRFFTTPKSQVTRHPISWKTIVWFADVMRNGRDVLGGQLEFWHDGRCGCCSRLLTVPESVERGIGPECWGRMR